MSALTDFKEGICSYLAQGEDLLDVIIHCEFPAKNQAVPFKRPTVAVGFESIQAKGGARNSFWGESEMGTVSGRELAIVLRLDIVCPGAQGGGQCHELFEALSDRLLFDENSFGIEKVWCEGISYEREVGAHRLIARAELSALLQIQREEATFTTFELRRLKE